MKKQLCSCHRLWPTIKFYSRSSHLFKEVIKPKTVEEHYHKRLPIISCKNSKLNHFRDQTYGKFSVVPLASSGWHHRKSKGDYFTVQNNDIPQYYSDLITSFEDLNVPSEIVKVLQDNDVKKPTNIQVKSISQILKGGHTLVAAETGSGKTLGYLLPLFTQLMEWKQSAYREKLNCPFGIIITPSRELAYQIGNVAKLFSEDLGINVEVLSGGGTKKKILNPSFKEVDLLVSTIGVLNKLLYSGIYRISHVKHVVMDEADTLLDDSFNDDVSSFLRRFKFLYSSQVVEDENPCVQLTMVSATLPRYMEEILGEFINVSLLKKVSSDLLHAVPPHVPQKFYRLGYSEKPPTLLRLVRADTARNNPVLIFSNRPATCDWISLFLNENNIKCMNLNKAMHYKIRQGRFEEFQRGVVNVLSTTDMASRGLDTTRVVHVVNYDFANFMADYVHRCGRTGRIGSPNDCYISHFVASPSEIDLVQKIELSIRKGEPLPNVNANIKRILTDKLSKQLI